MKRPINEIHLRLSRRLQGLFVTSFSLNCFLYSCVLNLVFCVLSSPTPLFVPFIASDISTQYWQSGLIRRCESFSLLRNDYVRLVNHFGFILGVSVTWKNLISIIFLIVVFPSTVCAPYQSSWPGPYYNYINIFTYSYIGTSSTKKFNSNSKNPKFKTYP